MSETSPKNTAPRPTTPPGDRIAKVVARAGVASRRDAERMIEEGHVTLNGKRIYSPARNVGPTDRITVDGKPLPTPDRARLWLYHKPTGLVTTARDEKGRSTIFDDLPAEIGLVNPVGRLDITSEGLLLLTNDGALKRRLELPSTGWLRRYRVRINGSVSEASLERLRQGIEVEDGTKFQPMEVTFDRQQGANAWLTVALREGKNREIRRAMETIGVVVNRLIRVSYGPFQLGNLAAGSIEEVRTKVLREQLGEGAVATGTPAAKQRGVRRDGDDARAKGSAGKPVRAAQARALAPQAKRASPAKRADAGPGKSGKTHRGAKPDGGAKPDTHGRQTARIARKPAEKSRRTPTRNAPRPGPGTKG